MRQAKCKTCGLRAPLGSLYRFESDLYCEVCAQKKDEEAAARAQSMEFERIVDPTVCVNCGADNGSIDFPQVAGLHWCSNCLNHLYNRPFPAWLRLALAALLVLLGVSLVHGAKYFRAGRSLFKGEKLVEQQRFAKAVPYLREAVEVAPLCEECILLLAKAHFLSGRFDLAWKQLQSHQGGMFEKSDLSAEVRQISERVEKALQKAEEARQLAEENRFGEASQAIHKARSLYPEFPPFAVAVAMVEAGAAFEREDYDAFLEVAEAAWQRHPESSMVAAQVASALACKYAVTNAPVFRSRSEEMLKKAERLSTSPEEKEAFQEYAERIHHRLRTRVIIDKDEYDRRYRGKTAEEKH